MHFNHNLTNLKNTRWDNTWHTDTFVLSCTHPDSFPALRCDANAVCHLHCESNAPEVWFLFLNQHKSITVAQKWTERPPYMLGPQWHCKLNLPRMVLGFSDCLFGFLAHSLSVWARFLKHTSTRRMTSEAGCQLNFKNSLASLLNFKSLTLCWAWLEIWPWFSLTHFWM